MDLVVNGPCKSGIRKERCEQLFDYFQNYKIACLRAQAESKPLPKFQPPKPKVADGLRILRKVCQTTFKTEKFQVSNAHPAHRACTTRHRVLTSQHVHVLAQRSMAQCFVSVGLAPDPSTGLFVKYKNHRRGTMPIEKVDKKDDETCLGEIAAELEMVQRDGVESDDEGEQEQGDEEDEDEDEDEDEEP